VEEVPSNEQGQDFGFSGAGRHFHHVARPVFIEHAGGHRAGRVEPEQIIFVASAPDLEQPDDRLHCFALSKVVMEG